MKMILKLSFMSDFWLGVINLKNAKRLRNKLMERIKELMLVVWHPTSWCQGMRKKE